MDIPTIPPLAGSAAPGTDQAEELARRLLAHPLFTRALRECLVGEPLVANAAAECANCRKLVPLPGIPSEASGPDPGAATDRAYAGSPEGAPEGDLARARGRRSTVVAVVTEPGLGQAAPSVEIEGASDHEDVGEDMSQQREMLRALGLLPLLVFLGLQTDGTPRKDSSRGLFVGLVVYWAVYQPFLLVATIAIEGWFVGYFLPVLICVMGLTFLSTLRKRLPQALPRLLSMWGDLVGEQRSQILRQTTRLSWQTALTLVPFAIVLFVANLFGNLERMSASSVFEQCVGTIGLISSVCLYPLSIAFIIRVIVAIASLFRIQDYGLRVIKATVTQQEAVGAVDLGAVERAYLQRRSDAAATTHVVVPSVIAGLSLLAIWVIFPVIWIAQSTSLGILAYASTFFIFASTAAILLFRAMAAVEQAFSATLQSLNALEVVGFESKGAWDEEQASQARMAQLRVVQALQTAPAGVTVGGVLITYRLVGQLASVLATAFFYAVSTGTARLS